MTSNLCPACLTPWVDGFGCTFLWCYYYGVDAEQEQEPAPEGRSD